MEKRNKLWRKRHQWRLFKARMILRAAYQDCMWDEDRNLIERPHWFELAKQKWNHIIRLPEHHVVAGCVRANRTIVGITRKKLDV